MTILEFIVKNYIMLLAIYGSIISTLGIILSLYNYNRDKAKIKVKASFGVMGSGKGAEGPFFFVKAINKGRRPVTLSSVGIRVGKDDLINIKTISLPRELGEGKSHSEWFTLDELRGRDCDFAWYRDETGKIYKSKSIKQKLHNYFNSEKKSEISF
ncbi:hypothetical protein HYV49_04980 [Candidatus Pacearchaeota archaeon]|nr:hypothetical protein [Candidatus Pacearchaeota archaeon]